jgi:PAS domain S-box-containing protein
MSGYLRILHLEDDRDYSDLVKSLLEKEGYGTDIALATSRGEFEKALDEKCFDVILADYLLPDYDGIEALQYAKEKCPETPFILISGTIGEQVAIESLKSGATDYVLKMWPERLGPTVRRAVQEAEERVCRRQVEMELRRREKYFRALTENALDILTVLNKEGAFVYNSASIKGVLGYEPQELVGQSAFSLAHPDDLGRVMRAFEEALNHPDRAVRLETRIRHRDGSWRHLEVVGQNRLADPEIGGVFINTRDVTDRVRLEDQLRQSQKMEAIGQLAGGVAHDFNNILTVIQGHVSLLQSGGTLNEMAGRSAQQIGQAAERAASLTRQLLTFSRRQVMQPRRLDLNDVVGNMSKMLGRILGEDIALRLHYSGEPAVVEADSGMLEQVLLNLAVNSRDAMPKGGELTIRIMLRQVEGSHLIQHPDGRAGKFVCLTVKDNGCGIPPENLGRIFDPFFTTKEVGKGTGLGLATVYGIVKQHQGWVEVESVVGQGTTFSVMLPRCEGEVARAEQEEINRIRGGKETILVVEDEAPVRELVCNLLAGHGYQILQAESGAQALEMWTRCKDKVDLLLTDLVMPDRVSGRELAEKLWRERPELKVIFTSGYSSDVAGKDFVLQQGFNYLQKPYHPHRLASAVRDCLDASN